MAYFSPRLNITPKQRPRVLTIAGSDSGGGAGIQADLKSISAFGGYGLTAITVLTAQNTQGVLSIFTPPVSFLSQQLQAVTEDIEIDAVKIGMLGSVEIIETVNRWIGQVRPPIVVLDPVMVATSGDRLLEAEAESSLFSLVEKADVITPNAAELAMLAGEEPRESWDQLLAQGRRVARRFSVAVLVKGGHCQQEQSNDALLFPEEQDPVWQGIARRVETTTTHGTGCSLSAALATLLARTGSWSKSLNIAKVWLTGAIEQGATLQVGQGNGPVDHFHHITLTSESDEEIALRNNFATEVWRQSEPVRAAIESCEFVGQLGAGTLNTTDFLYYIDQDARYLAEYSRALALVGHRAPSEESRSFFLRGAVAAVEVESELHRSWIARWPRVRKISTEPSKTTRAYTDFLLAKTHESYPVAAAAVLPCYWLYADIGKKLYLRYRLCRDEHPYREWLETYAADDFQQVAEQAIHYVNQSAQTATVSELHAMKSAFLQACQLELEFFDAPLDRDLLAQSKDLS